MTGVAVSQRTTARHAERVWRAGGMGRPSRTAPAASSVRYWNGHPSGARAEHVRRGGKGGPLSGDGGPCGGLGLRPAVAGESGGDLVEDGAVEGQ